MRSLRAVAVAVVGALMPLAARAQPVTVEVDGEACGLADALPRALARRGLVGVDLSVRVVIDDATMRITLADRGGALRERRVPRSPSCAADLDLLALIVERQQRELGLDEGDLSLPPQPTLIDRHLELGLRAGPEVGARIRGDVELLGRLEWGRFVELLAGLRLVLPSEVQVTARAGEGAIGAWALGAFGGGGVGLDTGAVRLFIAGSFGVERTASSSSGALFQQQAGSAWTPVLGVEARYERAIWEDLLWLSLGLAGRFRWDAPTFTVEGASSSFAVPDATLVARIGVWVRFF